MQWIFVLKKNNESIRKNLKTGMIIRTWGFFRDLISSYWRVLTSSVAHLLV